MIHIACWVVKHQINCTKRILRVAVSIECTLRASESNKLNVYIHHLELYTRKHGNSTIKSTQPLVERLRLHPLPATYTT